MEGDRPMDAGFRIRCGGSQDASGPIEPGCRFCERLGRRQSAAHGESALDGAHAAQPVLGHLREFCGPAGCRGRSFVHATGYGIDVELERVAHGECSGAKLVAGRTFGICGRNWQHAIVAGEAKRLREDRVAFSAAAGIEMRGRAREGLRCKLRPFAIGAVVLVICGSLAAVQPVAAQDQPSEYQVKAAYLFNFLKFVDWPSDAFADPLAPVVIGIVGDDPFGSDLSQIILGKTVMNRDVIVRKYKAGDDLKTCQILFISSSEEKRWPRILDSLRGSSVLTVADMDNFIEAGGMIQFKMENNRVRFAIGLDSAEHVRLKISSKLLAVAQSVASSRQHTK
jgi:hypothetical protein